MPVALNRDIRKTLNEVVRKARVAAEEGAQTALRQLGVADVKRPSWLSEADASLRVRLRAHARTLGDALDTGDPSRMPRLVREIAYAHWHRALFARFLLENGLLVDVEAGNALVRPDELREIAEAEGRDVAEVASEFAGPMLPEIFPKDDPVLALPLPPETRQRLSELVDGLPAQTFKADDSLGWTYQFWQEDRKKKVNESEVKIGADELPAVTQLFTEDYMVLFLLENTLGAWWAGKRLAEDPGLARDAADEDELRRKLSLPGYAWTYLRFVREDDVWRPAAGTFPGWPQQAAGVTVLDPCMGSGHFLVFALDILVALRKAEEGLDDGAAVMAVLRDNLHGLEIDPRCTQIAAFALALAAWKRLGGVRALPTLHVACSGLAIGMGKNEFVDLAKRIAENAVFGDSDQRQRQLTPAEERSLARRLGGLDRLYELFAQAPVFGSLIEPRRTLGHYGSLFSEGFEGLESIVEKILHRPYTDPALREVAVTTASQAKAAELLTKQFTLVATNVPYLGRRKMGESLQTLTEKHYAAARADLSTCMLERAIAFAELGSTVCAVTPQTWLNLTTFTNFRSKFLKRNELNLVASLGSGAFETITGVVVNVALLVTTVGPKTQDHFSAMDVSSSGFDAKITSLSGIPTMVLSQSAQISNPNSAIILAERKEVSFFTDFVDAYQGTSPGDGERVVRFFWELPSIGANFAPFQNSAEFTTFYGGREEIINWRDVQNEQIGAAIRGERVKEKSGFCIGQISQIPATIFSGGLFSTSCPVIIPKNQADSAAIWCFIESGQFAQELRKVTKSFSVANGYIGKIPFDERHWRQKAIERFTHGLPKPHSNNPTQWLFSGDARGSTNDSRPARDGSPKFGLISEHPLQVSVARLLGYRWPRQMGSSFMDCPAIEEPDKIDRAGVVDADGIVCLPAVHGEPAAHERVRAILRAAWGSDWADGVERACLEAEDWDKDLESWLADGFFDGHCKLFQQTPFIWHIWDGVKGGFSALVNYHKLCAPNGEGRRLLEKLRDTYLGEWIGTQRRLVTAGDATAEDRLAAAEHLRDQLTAIIEGEPPYDIFVRWKPLHRQPIGWEPDIDDGLRLNIRPFLTATTWRPKAKKSCILRIVPGVKKHEGADRGGEPHREKDDYPWFWAEEHEVEMLDFAGGPEFKGRRYNDFHYTRAFKRAARDRKASRRPLGSEAAE